MIKTKSSFKIKKPYKAMAATIVDPHKRREFLNMMIQAQLAEEAESKKPIKMKDKE